MGIYKDIKALRMISRECKKDKNLEDFMTEEARRIEDEFGRSVNSVNCLIASYNKYCNEKKNIN